MKKQTIVLMLAVLLVTTITGQIILQNTRDINVDRATRDKIASANLLEYETEDSIIAGYYQRCMYKPNVMYKCIHASNITELDIEEKRMIELIAEEINNPPTINKLSDGTSRIR